MAIIINKSQVLRVLTKPRTCIEINLKAKSTLEEVIGLMPKGIRGKRGVYQTVILITFWFFSVHA